MTISCGSVDILAVGSISFSSTPTVARIWLAPTGQTLVDQLVDTNTTITGLVVGSYDIKLVKATYQDYTATVSVTDGGTTIVSATLTLATGNVSFTSTPTGAEIFIDTVDQLVVTPSTISGLTPGSHSYALTKAGYVDATGSFNITGGSTTTVPTVTLYTVANITATSITVTPRSSPCVEGTCIVDVSVTWTNNGQTSGNFTPNITIDAVPVSPAPFPEQALAGGGIVTKAFVVSGLLAGTSPHVICPSPN